MLFNFIKTYYELGFTETYNPFFLEKLKQDLSVELETETEKILQPIYSKVLINESFKAKIYKHQILVVLCIARNKTHKVIYNKERIAIPIENILLCTSDDEIEIKKTNNKNIYALFSYAYKYYTEN